MRRIGMWLFSAVLWAGADEPALFEWDRTYGDVPLGFEPNVGQADARVQFLARGRGYAILLSADSAVLHCREAALTIRLPGADPLATVEGHDPLLEKRNYLIGRDPRDWHTDIPTFARVAVRAVYPGVDLVYYGAQRDLEYDFLLAPGADPNLIRLAFEGIEQMRVEPDGALWLSTGHGEIRQHQPRIYQEQDGAVREIPGHFVSHGRGEVGFALGEYDRSRALVIDPRLSYGTYFGGRGIDSAAAIAVDSAGSAYVTGWSDSPDLPAATTTRGLRGSSDIFVIKVKPEGNAFLYTTYIGGRSDDRGFGIAVDSSGAAMVTGWTQSRDFPTAAAAFGSLRGSRDAFVLKLNAQGNGLLFSTYLGGSSSDSGNAIALGPANSIYVAGDTYSTDFPTASAFQSGSQGRRDAFAAKFSSSGTLQYSTYIGGSADDQARALAVDGSGNAYLTGSTESLNFPVASALQSQKSGGQDAFVVKLNSTGNGLLYGTYLGGTGGTAGFPETGSGIAVDSAGNAYITGTTSSPNFPTRTAAQAAFAGGGTDAFVAKLNAAGNGLLYSTYLGGVGDDAGTDIAVASNGGAYVTGYTTSINFPTAGALQSRNAGLYDAFVLNLNASGQVMMATYLGGSGSDSGYGIALDALGRIYVAGQTLSLDFPLQSAIYTLSGGMVDAFVIRMDAIGTTYSISGPVTLSGSGLSGVTMTLSGAQGASTTTNASGNYSLSGLTPGGSYTVTPSRSGYNFTPPSQTFSNLSANQTAGFTAAVAPYAISGQVTFSGSGLSGVNMALSGSQSGSTTTDAAGNYRLSNLPPGGSYTITPSRAGYNFTPPSQTFSNLSGDQSAGFTASQTLYSISGQVTLTGNGLGGGSIVLSGSQSGSTTSDASGNYTFTGLAAGGSYTVTPTRSGYSFNPPSQSFSNLSNNQIANFAAISITYSISGQVTRAGSGVSGVTITLGGSQSDFALTDVSGNYSFTGLAGGGSYSVTPSRIGYNFTPLSQTFSNLNGNQTANFTATSTTYSISGQVTLSGTGLGGVAMTLSGSQSGSTTTDASGNYSFSDLPPSGYYLVTPARSGYTFNPPSQSFNSLSSNQTANFSAAGIAYSISGQATLFGSGLGGVTMTLSGSQTDATTSDASGNYAFTGLAAGGSYTVTPSRSGYSFNPPGQSFSNLSSNQVANFAAISITYGISGKVTLSGSGFSGVTMTLSGSQSDLALTDASGTYSFSGLAAGGSYTVTPSRSGDTFNPSSQTFNNLSSNQVASFSATLLTYTISGQVMLSESGLGGVTMTLTGSQSGSTTTDTSGRYSFSGLPPTGYYIVTPARSGYTFNPPSQSFNNPSGNQVANFSAAVIAYSISGQVTLSGGALSGVTMTLSGSQSGSTTTDVSGNYSFSGLPPGGSYTVMPSRSGHTFSPPSQSFYNLSGNQTASFTATAASITYSISGQVLLSGTGLSGVTMTLSGSQNNATATDASGNYTFSGLPLGGSYTVTPARGGYTFTPPNRTFNALSSNQTASFTATAASITYSISGQVTLSGGALSGVTMTLSGSRAGSTTTDGSGNYRFSGLPPDGYYIVTPARSGYTFNPPNQTFNTLSSDQTSSFTATLVTYSISGQVAVSGSGLGGVTMTLSGSPGASTTTSDAAGNYRFSNLPPGGSYTITPSRSGYTFNPPSQTFSNLDDNRTANFAAVPITYGISGQVLLSGTGLSGVTMALSGSQSDFTITDASGNYTFSGLTAGGSYTITPARTGYTFNPLSQSFSSLAGDCTASFAATLLAYTISGQVSISGSGLGGVTMTLSGSQTGSTTTDASGRYSFSGLPPTGYYIVTPARSGYTFNPPSQSFNNPSGNQVANFSAAVITYSISGQVTLSGAGLSGVAMTLSGSQSGSTSTDASGAYNFSGLLAGGSYTITPARSGYTFSPPSQTFPNLSGDQAASFAATATWITYGISGQVTLSGSGLGGVTMTLSGSQSGSTSTDTSGNYAFTGLMPGGYYTVTPSRSGYTFSPPSQAFSNLGGNRAANFRGIAVLVGNDLALGKAAMQSSTLPGYRAAGAASAVDGNADGKFFNGSVTHTDLAANPWWQVDLGGSAAVSMITLWNRTDCCAERLNDYWVFVSDTPFAPNDVPATLQYRKDTWSSHQTAAPDPGATITVSAPGRYLRVQLESRTYLSLAEVQVFGTMLRPAENLAVGKQATQSSTLGGDTAQASSAVDGVTDGKFFNGSVTHTDRQPNAWWQVDLGGSSSVDSIVIWNRTDCCGDRLGDYWVFVSDAPFAPDDTPATLQSRPGTWSNHQNIPADPTTTLVVGAPGRYVRVQLSGTNYLSLAEVQVFGQAP